MAVAADVKTFWSALLSVLLKCIAALGFGRTANAAAVRPQAVPAGFVPAAAADRDEAAGRAGSRTRRGKRAKAAPPARTARRTAKGSGAGSGTATGTGACRVPAPRGCEPQLGGRDRKRTLPPTMKQRISAEAHGSSPSARSLRVDDMLGEEFAGAVSVPTSAPTSAHAGAGVDAGTGTGTGAGHDVAREPAPLAG
ncbi:DUF6344 domain-containing protein [Streptomyces sp. V4-01]|uniref:DUF6344 domain-containing protein n=1 Tax=Actinacidiphila polyblastidii TaxID=3110430 RepID=A0ABU7P5L3_9ACTN|nr:DUF6344 domain-containing protein [Streptomyces sp. V4-01]